MATMTGFIYDVADGRPAPAKASIQCSDVYLGRWFRLKLITRQRCPDYTPPQGSRGALKTAYS